MFVKVAVLLTKTGLQLEVQLAGQQKHYNQIRLAEVDMTAACLGLGASAAWEPTFSLGRVICQSNTPGGVSAGGTRDDLPGAILFRHFVATGRRKLLALFP